MIPTIGKRKEIMKINYTEEYDNLILVMENYEELVIPQQNLVTPVEITFREGCEDVIDDYKFSFKAEGCYSYMFHPDNGITEDVDKLLHRLREWKDITRLMLEDNPVAESDRCKTYFICWQDNSIDNDQQHAGQYVDVVHETEGAFVTLTCKAKGERL